MECFCCKRRGVMPLNCNCQRVTGMKYDILQRTGKAFIMPEGAAA